MHRVEGDVEEQRLVLVALANKARRLIGQQERAVPFVSVGLIVAMPVKPAVADVREVVERAVVVTVLMIEAAGGRQILLLEMAEVPLADDRGLVAGFLEGGGEGALLERQAVLRPRANDAHLQTMPHRIPPGQKG